MSVVELREATAADAEYIIDHLRSADVEEIRAAYGDNVQDVAIESVTLADESYVGAYEGVPFALFGVGSVSFTSNTGTPWLIGTDEITKHSKQVLVVSRAMIKDWMTRYAKLENYVDARNTVSIRWLKWLGFTIDEAQPYGVAGLPFHRFWRIG